MSKKVKYQQIINDLHAEGFSPLDSASVAVVVKNHEGKVLIIRRSLQDNFGPGLWDLPAGSCDYHHIGDIKESALRELSEEAGIDIHESELEYLHHYDFDCAYEKKAKKSFIFETKIDENTTPKLSFEHEEYVFVSVDEIQDYEFLKIELVDQVINVLNEELVTEKVAVAVAVAA